VLRIATYNVSLGRNGPGMLWKGILARDAQVVAVVRVIANERPDVLLLTDFDWDYDGVALSAFRQLLAAEGLDYPYSFAPAGNAGVPAGRDLDGDGRDTGWRDTLGFGKFRGSGAMALLSRFPFGKTRSFTGIAGKNGLPLAYRAFWDITVQAPDGNLRILASHTTPPVFDGPENENGLRNAAEIGFWLRYLEGATFTDDTGTNAPFAGGDFVLLGDLNNDPVRGEGLKPPLLALLSHPLLQDVPDLRNVPTADWGAIGQMRVDYVLPARQLNVTGATVIMETNASNHALVRVDITR